LREDLPGWLAGLNANRAGQSERQVYLAAWSGQPICVDRRSKTRLPVLVPEPFLCVISGVSLDRLALLRQDRGRADNLLQRFLFAFPDPWPAGKWNRHVLSIEAQENWAAVWNALRQLQGAEEQPGYLRPVEVQFSKEAESAWSGLFDRISAEINGRDFPDHLRGPWLALQSYGARLALILHYLWWQACQTGKTNRRRRHEAPAVEPVSVERASRLIAYFQGHARKVYACVGADPRVNKARVILRWLERTGPHAFSRRQAHHALSGTFPTVADLEPALDILLQYDYVRIGPTQDRPGPGRKPSQVYEVNPLWLPAGDKEPGKAGHSVNCVNSVEANISSET
jgi:hypothetical protein